MAAPPLDNAANEQLVSFLTGLFDLPRRSVHIIAGERNRHKRVAIDGLALETARRLLQV